jgi:hypothetical protein
MNTKHHFQGVGTRDDIDKTLKLGMNHPMGPLQLGKRHLPSQKLLMMSKMLSVADLYVLICLCYLDADRLPS